MKFRTLALLLLLAPSVQAQEVRKAYFTYKYDLDSTSFIYCVATGKNGSPWDSPRDGSAFITTSGSSTTVTELVTDSLPFALLSVGDIIELQNDDDGNTPAIRVITAKASGASITVNTAIDISTAGKPFRWRKVSCGTTATSGWIDVGGFLYKKITVHLNQMNATSIDIRWEGRDLSLDTNPEYIYPGSNTATGTCPGGTSSSGACNYTAAGIATRTAVEVDVPYDSVRVGMKVNTDDGGDTGANAEEISGYVTVWGAK
jgi:hypothetical protein